MKPKPDLLRSKMIKYPKCYLWNKSIWSNKDLLFFKQRLNIPDNKFKIKVIRVIDGFIYESIKLCMLENKICKKTMYKKLKLEKEYKLS